MTWMKSERWNILKEIKCGYFIYALMLAFIQFYLVFLLEPKFATMISLILNLIWGYFLWTGKSRVTGRETLAIHGTKNLGDADL